MKKVTKENFRRGNRAESRLARRALALLLAAFFVCGAAFAESVYRLDATTSTGVDLTAMPGYYADRMEGPASGDVDFAGPLTVDPSVSASNPFRLIGNGRTISVTALGSGFHSLPLMLYNADGVTQKSTLKYNANVSWANSFCSLESLDVGAYNVVTFGWGSDSGQVTFNSRDIRVHDGGSITTSYRAYFGYNRPISISITDGGSISVSGECRIGRQHMETTNLPEALTAFVGITNATFSCGGIVYLSYNVVTYDYDTANSRIVIGPNAVFSTKEVNHHGGGRANFLFDGGRFVSPTGDLTTSLFYAGGTGYGNTWPNSRIWLIGVNENSVDIEIASDRNLAGGKPSNQCRVYMSGNGGFTKRGAGKLYFNKKGDATCDYTGPTTILGGGIVVTNATFKPGRGTLSIAEGAFLDLNGFDVEFVDASGNGIVTNGADAASAITLGYGNSDGTFSASVAERISIVKVGTGTLTVSGNAANNACDLDIASGTVAFGVKDSTTYKNVTVRSGATLDISKCNFVCANLVKEPGGTIKKKPGLSIFVR